VKAVVVHKKGHNPLLQVILTNHAVHRLSQRLGHGAITRIRTYLLNERVSLFRRGKQVFLPIPTMGTFVGVQENSKFIVKTVLYNFLEQARSLQFLNEYSGAIVMTPINANDRT
jgi:hypothetical protein